MRYGTIEYRRYEKQLVAYDTALGAVQWTAPMESATFSIRNAVPDRLLDTGTLEVPGTDPDDRDARVGPVADLDATTETLELPVRTPLAPSVIRLSSHLPCCSHSFFSLFPLVSRSAQQSTPHS